MRRDIVVLLVVAALLGGCYREERRFSELAPSASAPAASANPAAGPPGPYDDNAWAISEGQRLYVWFNCQGCHAMGGGAIGPALMDDTWIYGSDPRAIFTSIAEGRPNGMPAFGGRLNVQQTWQLVAYVRSLSALTRLDVRPGRSDTMSVRPSPQSTSRARPSPPEKGQGR